MKGRFDVFTDAELYLMESSFRENGLWILLGEVNTEQKIRESLKPAERKAYDTWRDKFIKHLKEEKSE